MFCASLVHRDRHRHRAKGKKLKKKKPGIHFLCVLFLSSSSISGIFLMVRHDYIITYGTL